MVVRRRFVAVFLLVAAAYTGLDWMRRHVELAMLHVNGPNREHYTRVFVVDDPPAVWIRAERPGRLWLEALRSHPEVRLERGPVSERYAAEVREGERARSYVDGLFRAKYGAVDAVTGALWRRQSVPVRLERR